jgi:hypothetical protein
MNTKNRKRSEKFEPNGFPKPGPVHQFIRFAPVLTVFFGFLNGSPD